MATPKGRLATQTEEEFISIRKNQLEDKWLLPKEDWLLLASDLHNEMATSGIRFV